MVNAHTYDRLKHFGVGIPEEPTEAEMRRVLEHMVSCVRLASVLVNEDEIARLKGTAGEPVPRYEIRLRWGVRFSDDFRDADDPASVTARQFEALKMVWLKQRDA